jgi:molybdopterin-guanine dinucleotide biosynthesis protein A
VLGLTNILSNVGHIPRRPYNYKQLMQAYDEVSAFILAGGTSSRMHHDKALLQFAGLPLIIRTARLVKPLVCNVTVIGAPKRYADLGLPVIADGMVEVGGSGTRGAGPLAGIVTALAHSSTAWNLVLACDLPYLTQAWLDWLLSRAIHSTAQALVPLTANGLQPLAGVYRRECAEPLSNALARGVRRVTEALRALPMEIVREGDWESVDPNACVLKNMNFPEDYEEAKRWWENNEHARKS